MLIGINPWYYSSGPAPGYDWQYYLPPRYDYYPRNGRNVPYREYQTTVVSQNPNGFSDIPQAYSTDNSVVEVVAVRPTGNPIAYYIIIYIKGDGNCGITVTADGITKTYYTEVSNSFYAYPFNDTPQNVISTLQNFKHSPDSIGSVWQKGDTRTEHMNAWTFPSPIGNNTNGADDLIVRIETVSMFLPTWYDTVSGEKPLVVVSFNNSSTVQQSLIDRLKCIWDSHDSVDVSNWGQSNVRNYLNTLFKGSLQMTIPVQKVLVPSYDRITDEITYVEDQFFLGSSGEYCDFYGRESSFAARYNKHDYKDTTTGARGFLRGNTPTSGPLGVPYFWTRTADVPTSTYSPNYKNSAQQISYNGSTQHVSNAIYSVINNCIQPLAVL